MNANVPPEEAEMTVLAAQAFADYVAMPRRSLSELARVYQGRAEGVPTRQLSRLKEWSAKYGWQARAKTVALDDAGEAVELRRGIALGCLREYGRRMEMRAAMRLNDLHGIYDRVRDVDPVKHEMTGKDGGPIKQEHTVRDLSVFTDDEIDMMAAVAERVKSGEVAP